MRRKLWMLLILFLFLVGRESCCASQEQNQGQDIDPAVAVLSAIVVVFDLFIFPSIMYWYFDLHQKKEGRYTCKFYYAAGYRTKLFCKRIYFDFYSSFPRMILGLYREGLLGLVGFSFLININIRIYRDFYIILCFGILRPLVEKVFPSSQEGIDN